MEKALITTVPFGEKNRLPLDLLEDAGIKYTINPHNQKLTEGQLESLVDDHDIIIAGTEVISTKVMDQASNIKFISRVGIGLDGIDLLEAKRRGIAISYTPEAPAPAVAELTICLMLALLRSVHVSNAQMHRGEWNRIQGRRIAEVTVGIIGAGRIGARVLRRIKPFGTPRILVNDIMPNLELGQAAKIEWVPKEQIYREADIISLHLPLTRLTQNMIGSKQLQSMKPDAMIINTSRGGIINEDALYEVLISGHLGGAALDVYSTEPYAGNLAKVDRCLMTSHMGSMSKDCRARMEIEAVEEAVRFVNGEPLKNEVPQAEYDLQKRMEPSN